MLPQAGGYRGRGCLGQGRGFEGKFDFFRGGGDQRGKCDRLQRARQPGPDRRRSGGSRGARVDRAVACAGRSIARQCARLAAAWVRPFRSEEHTSELQSLMRISYAVFCLKKKTISNTITT